MINAYIVRTQSSEHLELSPLGTMTVRLKSMITNSQGHMGSADDLLQH